MVKLSIRATPDLAGSNYIKHAEAVRDWTRDAEKSLRSLETAANAAPTASLTTFAPQTVAASNLALTAASGVVLLNPLAIAGVITATATLPVAATVRGQAFTVKLVATAATVTVVVAARGAETIDGAGTYALTARYKYVTVQSDGSNWHVVAAG